VTSIVDLRKSQHNRPHQFIRYLSQKHDVTVVSINDWWKGKQDDHESYTSEFMDIFERIDYFYLTEKKVSPVIQELFFRKSLKKIVEKNDFDVHLNYNTLLSGYAISKKIRTVFDIADDLGAMIRESPQIPRVLGPIGGAFGDLVIRKNIERAEKVTATTEILKEKYQIPDWKCEIIPNGVDTDLFRDYGDTKKELGLDGFVVGYVGVLREWVDLEPVFRALAVLDNKEIKMVVVGKEGKFEENVNLARKYGVSDRVIFVGMIPHSQVPKYISAMDVCLIPFRANAISKSALPLKLFEYMACKKPIISTEIPGVKRVAGDRLLYASTRDEYKENILKLYNNQDLRLKLGEKGRQLVIENYNWKHISERLNDILITAEK